MNALSTSSSSGPVAAMDSSDHQVLAEEDPTSQLNNNGVSLLQQNRRSQAATVFLQALWRVEAKTGSSKDDCSRFGSGDCRPTVSTHSSVGERAKPSSYIYQREDYDEGLYVYREGLSMTATAAATPQDQLTILRYNMGQVYLCYKQYNQAKRFFQAAWIQAQHHKNVFSLQVPILHNLGFCYYCLGENEPALKCYQDALTFLTANNDNDSARAHAYNCIAVLLFHVNGNSGVPQNSENNAKALELLSQSLAIYTQVHGEHSPQVATCYGNMGRIHFLAAQHETALGCFHKAYQIRLQVLGQDHMDTAAMLFNLGQSLHFQGALREALEAYKEFLRVAQLYHTSHRDICAVQRAMAQVHRQRGDLKQATGLLQQAFQSGCTALGGPDETEVSCILSELGSLYAEANDYPNAIDCFLQFLETQEKMHDPLHTNILITKINLARVYKHSADYLSAFRYYKQVHALQVQLAARGTTNKLEVASTLSSMGLMLYLLHAYKPALDCYQEALRVRLDKLGTSQHADVAETINSIGLVLFKLGMMDMAKEAFRECIQLRTKLLFQQQQDGDDDDDSIATEQSSCCSKEIAVLLFNMATACLQNGEDDQGMEWYNESLRVERQVLGESHPDVSMTLQHIGRVHEDRGDFEQAIQYYQQALEIVRQANKPEEVARLLKIIGNLHFMQVQVAQGMTCFVEATRMQDNTAADTPTLEGVSVTGANFYGFSKLHPPCSPVA